MIVIISIIVVFCAFALDAGRKASTDRMFEESAKKTNALSYYNSSRKCDIDTRTGLPCNRRTWWDKNGDMFEYTVSLKMPMQEQKVISIRYLNVNKWNEPIQFKDDDVSREIIRMMK